MVMIGSSDSRNSIPMKRDAHQKFAFVSLKGKSQKEQKEQKEKKVEKKFSLIKENQRERKNIKKGKKRQVSPQ